MESMRSHLPDGDDGEEIECHPNITISEASVIAEDIEHHRISPCLSLQELQLIHITRVCSVWRRAAIGYPILWVNLFITPTTPPSLSAVWLERSQLLHINIVLDLRRHSNLLGPDAGYMLPIGDVLEIMDMIQSEVHRCKTMSVATSIGIHMQTVLSKLDAYPTASVIQELRLSHDDDDMTIGMLSNSLAPGRIFAGVAPNILKIRLSGIPLPSTAMDLMNNLTELSFRSLSGTSMEWMDLTHIFTLSPGLCQLTIWAVECEGIPPFMNIATGSPLTMTHLVSLAIGYIDSHMATSLISYIHCPNLRNLTLGFDEPDCDDIGRGLTAKHPNKATMLAMVTRLEVIGFSISPSIADILVGELRELHTMDFCGANHLFQGILDASITDFKQHMTGENRIRIDYICRHLRSVTITGTDPLAISSFAMMRKCMGLTIPYIRVFRCDFRTKDDYAYIDRFADHVEKKDFSL